VLEGLASDPFLIGPLLSPQRSRIRIRFDDREEAGKGIMLILNKYGSISGLNSKQGYGLNSEEQLKLLDEHGIKYQRI